jgi:hypothetical protein
MTTQQRHPRRIRAALGPLVFALLSGATMGALPLPTVPKAGAQAVPAAAHAGRDTAAPVITNSEELVRVMNRNLPVRLREIGESGTIVLSVLVSAEGTAVRSTVVAVSDPRLADAALRSMWVARFRPAWANGRAVPYTIRLPLSFGPGGRTATAGVVRRGEGQAGTVRSAGDPRLPRNRATARISARRDGSGGVRSSPIALTAGGDVSTRPDSGGGARPAVRAVSPRKPRAPAVQPNWDEAPILVNADEISRSLREEYPPGLRQAGIVPGAQVRVRLAATGAVERLEVAASHPEARVAVERAFSGARFRAARRNGEAVSAETVLSVAFRP